MSKDKVYIFDRTLRDGAQTEGVDFTVNDKVKIAKSLNDLGVDYIEGGWPGANPTDTDYFNTPQKLDNSIFTAFGMTKKLGRSADNDPSLAPILNANTKAVCIVGKTWDFHVDVALGIMLLLFLVGALLLFIFMFLLLLLLLYLVSLPSSEDGKSNI